MSQFLAEIRRRRVIQTFVPYLGFVWLVLQIVSVVTPMLNWHPLVNTFFAVGLFAGIPVMLYLSWYFDFTIQGLVPIADKETGQVTSFGFIRWTFLFLITASSGILGYQYFHEIKVEFAKTDEGVKQRLQANSIAVLPFKDNSPDQDQAFIGQGLAEEITSLLGRFEGLKVSASSSSAILNEKGLDAVGIARRLDVQTILSGSVRKTGDQLKVLVELINASDGSILWTKSFARKFSDIFAVESEIARSAVNLLQDTYIESGALTNLATTNSVDAYVIYLKGREQYRQQTSESMKQARKLFEQAIGLDPEYAQAYVALADTFALLAEGISNFGVLKTDIASQLAIQNLEKALVRQPDFAEAYAVLGRVQDMKNNLTDALAAFDKAIQLNPNLAVAYLWKFSLLHNQSRDKQAFEALEIALTLDPESITLRYNYGFELSRRGRFDRAIETYQKLIKDYPDSPMGYAGLGSVNFLTGNLANSLKNWKYALDLSPENQNYQYSFISSLIALELNQFIPNFTDDPFFEESILIGSKNYQQLFSNMAFKLAAYPDDPWIKYEAAFYQMLFGDTKKASELFAETDLLLTDLDKYVFPTCSPAVEIAWAHKEMGDDAKAKQIVKQCQAMLRTAEKEGVQEPQSYYLKARLAVLSGNYQNAVDYFEQAYKAGFREWWAPHDVLLKPIFNHKAVKNIRDQVNKSIQKERQKALQFTFLTSP